MSSTPWPDLAVSYTEVRRAGDLLRRWFTAEDLVDEAAVEEAHAVLDLWRSCHGFVRNTAAMGVRQRAHTRGIEADIGSRLKARSSILAKLADRPDLKLDSLRDIAGARAIVPNLRAQRDLVSAYDEVPSARVHDYLDGKASGYRAVHLDLVLEDIHTSDQTKRRRRVELQVRTRAQHDWADLVEDVGRRRNERLKQGRGSATVLERLRELAELYRELDERRASGRDQAVLLADIEAAREVLIRWE